PGYVKWTEQRNMSAFLELLAKGKIDLPAIVGQPVPFADAPDAYDKLRSGRAGVGILFEYPRADETEITPDDRVVTVRPAGKRSEIVIGCIGAGNYANTKLLPVLSRLEMVRLKTVVTTSGASAKSVALRLGFEQAATDCLRAFQDDEINTVIIATPHNSHAALICQSLRAGKAVFAEKPLAIDAGQLEQIRSAIRQTGNDRLQVGFNRRFAPLSGRVAEAIAPLGGPCRVLIRVNAGKVAAGSWVGDPEISGGRLIGEGCHFIDLAGFFVGENPAEVQAAGAADDADNLSLLLRYPNGSVATIAYVTSGSGRLAKEYIEVHRGGQTAVLDDFRRATLYGTRKKKLGAGAQDKGQQAQLKAFCDAVSNGEPMPIPLESMLATTRATFCAAQALKTGAAQRI
ncbi:MAG: Gfo/Idh/MocA family oxidoreductase, partial [Planctomycetota bacterium]|nr:Gfo/Idh/MocA family oxidoreductase [Planctomycetota bacterium]